MKAIQQFLQEKEDIQSLISGVSNGMKEQLVAGLVGPARSMLISTVHEATKRPILLVTHQLLQAEQLYDDLIELVGEERVQLYPVNELIASEIATASPELRSQRIEALNRWSKGEANILIAPVAALKRMLPSPNEWLNYQLHFKEGEEIDIETYFSKLIDMGYERTQMVTAPGEFSRRGGIIDIYPLTEEHPLRIELFDVEIDSIRYFDADTQRSLERIQEVSIGPATELLVNQQDLLVAAERIEKALAESLKNKTSKQAKEELIEIIEHDVSRLKNNERFQEMYKYIGFFYEEPKSLLDYLPSDCLIFLEEMGRIQETAVNLDKEEAEWYLSMLEANRMVKDSRFSFDWDMVLERMNKQRIYMSVFLRHIPNTQPENIINLSTRAMQEFHGQMHLFKSELNRWEKAGASVIILTPNEKRADKVHSILDDYQIESVIAEHLQLPTTKPTIIVGNLTSGVELPMHKLVFITENELFKKRLKRRRKVQKISNAERIKSYQELNIGDYVVHTNHGVGKYMGIETLELNGLHKDYMLIKYSGDDKLFVPIDQIDLVQKYVGSEGKEPKLYKLGGSEWTKVKRRVQSSVEDIADDLIKLYADCAVYCPK